LQSKSLVKED